MECCVICSESDGNLMQCIEAESWVRFYRAAVIKQQVNRISFNDLCSTKLEYRRNCVASKHLE